MLPEFRRFQAETLWRCERRSVVHGCSSSRTKLEGAPHKLRLGGDFDVHRSQTLPQLRK